MTSYAEYLSGPLWQKIRKRVLKRDRHRCRGCGRRAWQVHHGRYDADTMQGLDLTGLYAVCGGCHQAITFTVMGDRRPAYEVGEMTRAMDRPVERKPRPRKAKKPRRPKLTLGGIRALSQEYAEGRMP